MKALSIAVLWVRLGMIVAIGLVALPLAMSDDPPGSAVSPQPGQADGQAPSIAPGASGKVQQAEDLEQSLKDLLDGVKPDKEPAEAPKLPPATSPTKPAEPHPVAAAAPAALPPAVVFARAVQSADAEKLSQIGKVIAAKLEREQDEAVRRVLIEAGTKVVEQHDRLAAAPQPPPRQRLHPDIEKLAYRQALGISNGTKGLGRSAPDVSSVGEISRAAWEGGQRLGSGVVVAPQGTEYFTGTFKRMNDATPYNPGAHNAQATTSPAPIPRTAPSPATTPPANAGPSAPPAPAPAAPSPAPRPRRTHEPPPPPAPQAEKGVRIAFDPVALELASSRAPLLGEVEDRLLAARRPDQVDGALAWVDERVNDALQAGATTPLDRVTVVSLRRLCQAAAAHRQHWAELPVALRHPGPLRRVHGFVIDAAGQDVLLLGTSEGPGDPIDIDDLSQAIRAVWRDGLTPICSLDPEPWNMAGPQRAVIAGVTRSSHFARVMLDADYQLKKVLFGDTNAQIAGFQSLKDAAQAWVTKLEAADRPLSFTTRFWFTSVPPGAGDIRLSPDGRMALFDARVQVLTENMLNRGNVLVNAGTQHPLVVGATRGFTLNFAAFQQQMPIFRQLQSLFDVALAATLLKRQGAPPGVLEELAALPIRSAEVPDTYAGLTVAAGQRGLHVMYLQGGVQMTTPIGSRAAIRVNDPRSERVRQRAAAAGVVARQIEDAALRLVSCTGTSSNDAEGGLTKTASARADIEALDEMIEADPENGEYRKQRARAYCRLRLYYLAEQELRTAECCLPDDPAIALLRLQVHLERGEKLDLSKLPMEQVETLADFYLIESVHKHGAGDSDAALAAIDWALTLRPGRMDLVFHRANILLARGSPTEAIALLGESVRQSPRDARLRLARAQANFRCQHWDDAIADATCAIELEPRMAHAYLVRAVTLLSLTPPDMRRAYADLRHIQELDPQNPGALVVRANLLRLEGDRDGATAAVNRAVRLSPMMPEARSVRALIDAEATLKDLESTSSRALRDQATALQMLDDLNIVLASQPTNWQMRVLRSQVLLAYFNRLNDTELDWTSILPKLAAVIDGTPHGRQRFASAKEPTTVEEAVQFRQMFTTALADAIADELATARTAAPEELRPQLLEQENLLRTRAEHTTEEQKP